MLRGESREMGCSLGGSNEEMGGFPAASLDCWDCGEMSAETKDSLRVAQHDFFVMLPKSLELAVDFAPSPSPS